MASEKSNVASISELKVQDEPGKSKSSEESNSQHAPKSKPKEILPTARIAFPKQLDLLRAYAASSGPTGKAVTNNDIAGITGMHPNTISLSNAFFLKAGFLSKSGNGFLPSPEVVSFNNAHQWNPEAAPQKLFPLLKGTWFAQAILPNLNFRPLSEGEAIEKLAETCSASTEYKGQLRLLLDYLEKGGLIKREGGNIHQLNREKESVTPVQQEHTEKHKGSEMGSNEKTSSKTALSTMFSQSGEGIIQFHISVKVDMSEFKEWQADRIAAFFGGIAQVLAAKGSVEQEVGLK